MWLELGLLVLAVFLTYGCRGFGVYLAKIGSDSRYNDKSSTTYASGNILSIDKQDEIIKKRGVFWKIYAWVFLIVSIACVVLHPDKIGWLLYIPASIGCLLFAHNKFVCHPWLWKTIFYLQSILLLFQIVRPFLISMSVDTVLIWLIVGPFNIITIAPALYAIFQRGFNKELLKQSQLQPTQNSIANYKTIHDAAASGDLAEVEWFLHNGVDVNAKDEDGLTALLWAIECGQIAVVKYLVAKGADVNAKNKDDVTPLMLAACNGQLDIVEFLVSKGVDVNAKDNGGQTPLMLAAEKGHKGVVAFLKQHGAKE
jgi:hypothetical protein